MPSTAPIKVPITGVDEYSKSFKDMTRKAQKLGKTLSSVGTKLTQTVTLPVAGLAVAGVKLSKDLNSSMANVGTLIPGETKRLSSLRTEVMKLAEDTATSSGIVAEGLYETISAFGAAESPVRKLAIATKMSKAGLSSVKDALGLTSAVTKGYGVVTDEAVMKAADLSFMTVKLGQTTFPELASSIGRVVPQAAALKISQEELFGSMATLTGVTGTASEVSTQLASIFGDIMKPTEKLQKGVKKLGFESVSAMVAEIGFAESLKNIGTLADGNVDKLSQLIKRKEGLTAIMALTGGQASAFTEKIAAMGKATGATDEAFRAQTEGINRAGFKFDQFIERLKNVGIRIGDKLLPVVERLLDRMEPLFDWFNKLSEGSLSLGLKIAAVAAAIGPVLFVVGKLITAVSTVVGWLASAGGLSGVLAALTGPVGIAVAAIAALVAITVYCWDEMKALRDAISGPVLTVISELKDAFNVTSVSMDGFGRYIKLSVGFVTSMIAPVVKLTLKLGLMPFRGIIRALRIAIQGFRVITNAVSVFAKAIEFVSVLFGNLIDKWLEGTKVGGVLSKIFSGISIAVKHLGGFIFELWTTVENFFSGIAAWLEKVGIKLDKTIEKQRSLSGAKFELAGSSPEELGLDVGAGTFDAAVLGALENNKSESTINIRFQDLPYGTKPEVERTSGGTVNVEEKGAILGGAV